MTHPFELAGLGKAPFRFVGVTYKVGPLTIHEANGVTTTVGSPGQPLGCCKYCGQGIAECCEILSADGKRFTVGNVCVHKVAQDLAPAADRAVTELRKERRKERDAKRIAAAEALLDADPGIRRALSTTPHPHPRMADRGATMLDQVAWLFEHAGNAGKIRAAKTVERAAAAGGMP